MTIEETLHSIADSLQRIAKVLEAGGAAPAAPAAPAAAPAATEEENLTPQQKAARTRAANKAKKEAEEAGGEPAAPASDPEPTTAIDRDAVKAKLTEVTNAEGLGRDVVVGIFQRLGVPNLKGLDPSDYAKAYALGDKALTEGADAILGGG